MARALRQDGLLPQVVDADGGRQTNLDELAAAIGEIREATSGRSFDIVIEGSDQDHSPAAWSHAGATWWLESMWSAIGESDPVGAARARLDAGPPAL
jgi:hypothetical protein